MSLATSEVSKCFDKERMQIYVLHILNVYWINKIGKNNKQREAWHISFKILHITYNMVENCSVSEQHFISTAAQLS